MGDMTDFLAVINPSRPWPRRVILERKSRLGGQQRVYIERKTYKAIVHVDGAIGHAKCGGCRKSVDLRDLWCRHCGARLKWGDGNAD